MRRKFWHYDVLSGVIVGIILFIIAGIVDYFSTQFSIFYISNQIISYLHSSTLVDRRLIGLALITIITLIFFVVCILRSTNSKLKNKKSFPWEKYKEDNFENLKWRWKYHIGKLEDSGWLELFCLKCDYELSCSNLKELSYKKPSHYECPNCNWKTASEYKHNELKDHVHKLIARSIRKKYPDYR